MKSVTLLALLAASGLLVGCSSNTSVSDDIVARVNAKEITAAELEKQYQARISGAPQLPPRKRARP